MNKSEIITNNLNRIEELKTMENQLIQEFNKLHQEKIIKFDNLSEISSDQSLMLVSEMSLDWNLIRVSTELRIRNILNKHLEGKEISDDEREIVYKFITRRNGSNFTEPDIYDLIITSYEASGNYVEDEIRELTNLYNQTTSSTN